MMGGNNLNSVDEALVRIEQQEARSSERNIQNSNETERSLSSQLMLISTVFITVSFAFIGSSELIKNINLMESLVIIIALLTIVLSVVCGVTYYLKSIKFYTDWGKLHFENYEAFRDGNLGVSVPDVKRMNDKVSTKNEVLDQGWLYAQMWLLGIGIFLSLLLLTAFLLKSSLE